MAMQEAQRSIDTELTKIIFSNSLEFIRATTQILQGLTSLLLTVYIALLVGFCKDSGLHGFCTIAVAFLPVGLFAGSLTIAFVQAVTYKGADITWIRMVTPSGRSLHMKRLLQRGAVSCIGQPFSPQSALSHLSAPSLLYSFLQRTLWKTDQPERWALHCNSAPRRMSNRHLAYDFTSHHALSIMARWK